MSAADLRGWLPIGLDLGGEEPRFELARLGAQRLTEPFFEESIARQLQHPFHQLFRRRLGLAEAQGWLAAHPGLPPAGFIFHVSRCGSTLVSQLLVSNPAHRVLSEPGPVDRALRNGAPADQRLAWFRAALGLLGQPAHAGERRLFVKFDSWHALYLPLIRAAYPEVPCLMLVREPVEVIASHLRSPGAQMVPGMLNYDLPSVDPMALASREWHAARVLAALQQAALAALREPAPGRFCVLDYADLATQLDAQVWPLFGWAPDEPQRALIEAALTRDAKSPSFPFTPDAERKRREAGPAAHEAAQQLCADSYRALLDLR